jgi:hypothetical protein
MIHPRIIDVEESKHKWSYFFLLLLLLLNLLGCLFVDLG